MTNGRGLFAHAVLQVVMGFAVLGFALLLAQDQPAIPALVLGAVLRHFFGEAQSMGQEIARQRSHDRKVSGGWDGG